jgi:uncharacterized protein
MTLSELESEVLGRFVKRVQSELQDENLEVKLFGSKARGQAHEDSDVDVLVIVSGNDWRLCDKIYDIATDLLLETGVSISPKVLSLEKYKGLLEQESPFVKNIMRDAVAV